MTHYGTMCYMLCYDMLRYVRHVLRTLCYVVLYDMLRYVMYAPCYVMLCYTFHTYAPMTTETGDFDPRRRRHASMSQISKSLALLQRNKISLNANYYRCLCSIHPPSFQSWSIARVIAICRLRFSIKFYD